MEKTTQSRRTITQVQSPEERFLELVRTTHTASPKTKDIEALRRHLQNHPDLWRLAGDMSRVAYNRLVDAIAQGEVSVEESLTVAREEMRKELGYQAASPLERLLIDQVVLCWLRLYLTEWRHTELLEGNTSTQMASYWDRRLSSAQRRYLRACETLARIRKLCLPKVQINISDKQLHVST